MRTKLLFLTFLMLLIMAIGVSADVSNDLLFHVDFNNGVEDLAGGLIPTGSVSEYISLGSDNYAARFDPDEDNYLNYGGNHDFFNKLNDSSGFTLATRVSVNSNTQTLAYGVVSRYIRDGNQRQFIIANEEGTFNSYTSPDGAFTNILIKNFTGTGDIDTYYNLIYNYNGTHIKQYVNTTLVSEEELSIADVDLSIALEIGRLDLDSVKIINGSIDHVSIFDGSVSEVELPDLIEFMETGVAGTSAGPATPVDMLDINYTNSEGLSIAFDLYYTEGRKGPLVLMADSWGSTKDSYRDEIEPMRTNYGFVSTVLNTRGKGASEGHRDALGYECKDIYELSEYLRENYAEYINESEGIHFMGYSAAGGKATVCSGRYPDYFTSIYATAGLINITKWYATAITPTDPPSCRERVGNSVNPGVVEYHPAGFPPVDDSIENHEAYVAREGSYLGPYNTLSSVFISHNDGDPRVTHNVTLDYNQSWHELGKTQDYYIEICDSNIHAMCNLEGGQQWINEHRGVITSPTSGDYRIGGWVETKKFKVEFLEDVGYLGHVNYDFTDNAFSLTVTTETYEGPTEIIIKEVASNIELEITDNSVLIATLNNGVINEIDSSYNIIYSSGDLSLTLPHMSTHTIQGTEVIKNLACNSISEQVYESFNLGVVALIILVAALIIGILMSAFGGSGIDATAIGATISMIIVSAILFVVGVAVFGMISGAIC